MGAKQDVNELLANHDLFQGIDPAQLNWLWSVASRAELRRGDVLYERGQPLNCLYVLLSGHIKVTIPAADEQEKVVEFLQAGDVFGEVMLISPSCSIARAQALTVGRVLEIEQQVLLEAFKRMPTLALRVLTKISQRMQVQIQGLESTAFKSAAQRVAEYVLRQPRTGNQTRFVYHKRSIASMLGLQPETFSRSLKLLASDGLISVQGSRVTIHDELRLQALSA